MKELEIVDTEHIIDAVSEFNCPIQDEEYNREYKKWRSNEHNKYGFQFISDTREIAYLDGVGFINRQPEKCEKECLKHNIGLIGFALCIFYLIEVFGSYAVTAVINLFGYDIQVDIMSGLINATYFQSLIVTSVVTVLKYVVPMLIIGVNLKMPKAVMFPLKIMNTESARISVPIVLLVCAFGYIMTFAWGFILRLVSISLNPPEIDSIENIPLMIATVLVYVFVFPILSELLYRGAIMQPLRQFGDNFALIFTSVVVAMMVHDITKVWYAFLISLCLGYIMLCTGSVKVSIIANVFLNLIYVLCAILPGYLPINTYYFIISCLIAVFLFTGFMMFLFLSRRTRNVMLYRFTKTFLKLEDKLSIALLSGFMLVWLVVTFVLVTVSVKIIV